MFPTVLSLNEWLPEPSLRRASAALEESCEVWGDDDGEVEIVQADFDLPERSGYLGLMARHGDVLARKVAHAALSRRAERGQVEAVEVLRALLLEPGLHDDERVDAARALYFAKQLPRRGRLDIVLEGEQRGLDVHVPLIFDREPGIGLEQAQRAALIQASTLRDRRKPREACAILSGLIQQALPRRAELALKHELAIAQLGVPALRRDGQRLLDELLLAPDCPLRTRLFHCLERLDADGEDGAQAAQSLLASIDWDAPHTFADAALALRLREALAWLRGEMDAALAAGIALAALGAFDVSDDESRQRDSEQLAALPDSPPR